MCSVRHLVQPNHQWPPQLQATHSCGVRIVPTVQYGWPQTQWGGFVADQFASGFVPPVPDERVSTGFVDQGAELSDGRGGLFDLAGRVVSAGDQYPCPDPLHPDQNRTPVRKAVKGCQT